MNEVSKIHLGRQAFTISVEAYKDLRAYIDAIKKQVGDKDVVEEVELRMAELLAEHGVSGDKVILPADVAFLKEQLGNPQDFKEDGDEPEARPDRPPETKKLFRDTDNAMVAGVAAGLAKYTGVDVILIRIIFVIGVFTGGWGILLYLILWLLVPEARTSSDRLQMAGKPVTVDSLKDIVERADVKGAARRANNSLAGPINSFFRLALKVVGIGFIAAGLCALFVLIGLETYLLLHSGTLLQDNIFPVGVKEHLLLDIALAVAGIISIFVVLFGMAMFRRKWPIHNWVTAMLVGLVFIGLATGGALAADVAPQVRDRYDANVHTSSFTVKPFNKVNVIGKDITVRYEMSDTYSVSLHYFGNANLSTIKTSLANGVLLIDASRFDGQRDCQTICLPDSYNMVITVASPNAPEIPAIPAFPAPLKPVPMPGSRVYPQ